MISSAPIYRRLLALIAAIVTFGGGALAAQASADRASSDSAVLVRIRDEGFHRSQVLQTALGISDLHGPRLAGSAAYLAAARWSRDRLIRWGIAQAALEPWGRHAPVWKLDRFSLEMTAPYYLRVTAMPRVWSPHIHGVASGAPLLLHAGPDDDLSRYRGRLRGRIVLLGSAVPAAGRNAAPIRRWTTGELDSLAALPEPGAPHSYAEDVGSYQVVLDRRKRLDRFLASEGVAALLEPSEVDAAVRVDGFWDFYRRGAHVPSFVVARDHYARIVRLLEAGRPARLSVSLAAHLERGSATGYNVVAEIPGTDPTLGPEVVMLGGHLDSWHAGTGATDNAAGCAVVMEVLRILHAVGARPRRTIRIGLWDGEEPTADYAGSVGYVRRHLGDPTTGRRLPDADRFDAYFNLDNGTGRIRGIFLQGDSAARPVLMALLAPFRDLGAATVSIANTGETDHMSFVGAGLPGFQFIQDPVDYESRTHHSNLDVGDYLLEEDLEQAAVVMAGVAYGAAMLDVKIPRSAAP